MAEPSPTARPHPGFTRPLAGSIHSRLDDPQSQQHRNKPPLGRTTNHNPMKTKTIAAYRLTTNHKLVLRDLDGVRKALTIEEIKPGRGLVSGKRTFFVRCSGASVPDTSVLFYPRDRVEILVEKFAPNGDQPLNPDLQTSWS